MQININNPNVGLSCIYCISEKNKYVADKITTFVYNFVIYFQMGMAKTSFYFLKIF